MATKVIFLKTGTSFTVPADWNSSDNTVELLDGGGGGSTDFPYVGGNGGEYRKFVNFAISPGASKSYSIGQGGARGTSPGAGGTTSLTGLGSPSLTYSGGTGANEQGGGAAGPGGSGGSGGAFYPGAGSWTSTHLINGTASVETVYPGEGGNSSGSPTGGLYGGGGGRNDSFGDPVGDGAAGLIVLTYNAVTITSGAGAAAGVGAASAASKTVRAAAGAASGSSTASAFGTSIADNEGVGAAAGAGSASAVGRSTVAAVGIAAGAAIARAGNIVEGVGLAAGKATVAGRAPPPLPGPCRILIGKIPGATYGVRISEPGYDAASNPVDDERLLFNSDWTEVLPIHQIGSFVHRTTADQGSDVVQTVSFSGLGFVPFVDFMVQANGDALPSGSDIWPSGRWYDRKTLLGSGEIYYWRPLASGDSIAYLRLNISATQIRAQSFVRNLSGNASQGAPRTWTIYYVIYRKQAA